MKYKVQVIADNSGTYAGNAMLYDSIEAACDAARNLMSRWMLVRTWRVVDENDVVVWDKELGPVDQPINS